MTLILNDVGIGYSLFVNRPDNTQSNPTFTEKDYPTYSRLTFDQTYDLPGDYFLNVFRQDGTSSNTIDIHVVRLPPDLFRVDPSSFVAGPDPQKLVIFGGGLDPTVQVYLEPPNGTPPDQYTPFAVTPDMAAILAKLQSTGQWKLHAQYGDGPPSKSLSFNVTGPLPGIDQIATKGITTQSATQTVTLQGHNIQPGAMVVVTRPDNGSILSPLRIIEPLTGTYAFDFVFDKPGAYGIQIRNPDGGTSASVSINVTGPLPVIDQVITQGLTTQSATQTVKLQCHNIQLGAVVVVTRPDGTSGETPLGVNVQDLTYTVNFVFDQPGTYKMQIRNPDGGLSSIASINAISLPALSLTGVSVDDPYANGFLKTLTVTGTGLVGGGTFALKLPDLSVLTFSSLQLQNFSSTGFQVGTVLQQQGGYTAQYINPDQKFTNIVAFNMLGITPSITTANPSTLPAGPNTVIVTVTGSGFNGIVAVKVGATTIPAQQLLSPTPSSFSFAFAFPSAGSVPVQVVNSGNTLSNIFVITVTGGGSAAPVINGFSPTSLVAGTGAQMLGINGQNFNAGAAVTVGPPGGVPSQAQVLNVTPTSITISFVFSNAGQYSITVTSGGQNSNTATLTVTAPAQAPVINSVSPQYPHPGGPQPVGVNGSNFANGLTVVLTLPNSTQQTFSGAQIQNMTPNGFVLQLTLQLGTYTIRVINPGGVSSAPFTFTVS